MMFTYYGWMHTKAFWELLGSAEKDCEGPDAPSAPGRNVWSHFDWTFIFIYIGRKNPIPIASTILLQNPLSKKEFDFFSQFQPTKPNNFQSKKNTQIFWDPFLLNLFDPQVTTMDLCNLGTDAASTLAVKVNLGCWFICDGGCPAWLVILEGRMGDFAWTRSWRSKNILRWSCKRFSQIHFFGGDEGLFLISSLIKAHWFSAIFTKDVGYLLCYQPTLGALVFCVSWIDFQKIAWWDLNLGMMNDESDYFMGNDTSIEWYLSVTWETPQKGKKKNEPPVLVVKIRAPHPEVALDVPFDLDT